MDTIERAVYTLQLIVENNSNYEMQRVNCDLDRGSFVKGKEPIDLIEAQLTGWICEEGLWDGLNGYVTYDLSRNGKIAGQVLFSFEQNEGNGIYKATPLGMMITTRQIDTSASSIEKSIKWEIYSVDKYTINHR